MLPPDALPARRQRLADRTQLRAAGLSRWLISAAQARGELVEVRPRVFAPAPLPPRGRYLLKDGVPDLAFVAETRAALLSLGGGSCARGRTAALLWAMDMLKEPTLLEVRVPHGRTRAPQLKGVRVVRSRRSAVVDLAVAGLEPVPVTTAVDTVLDCALDLSLLEAVVIADSALRRGLITVDELVAAVEARRLNPGRTRLLKLLAYLDPESGSVLESALRVLLLEHGLVPRTQFTVLSRDGKRRIGRFDFCFEDARLIIECDGRRWHAPEDVRRKDRHKDNELERLGWKLLRFTWDEVISSKAYVLGLVRDCLAQLPAAA